MVELTMRHPGDCLRWAMASPLKWAVAVGVGMIFGIGLGGIVYQYVRATAPQYPELVGEPTVWRGKAGTIWIQAHYESAAPFRCLRQDAQLLINDQTGPRRIYYFIGAGLGGRGLKGSMYSYDILRSLPADYPSGDWPMITRLHYECDPMGLVHWEHTMPAVTIHIPE